MKVLHVIPSLSERLGGPTQVVINLVRELVHCGVVAEIVTTTSGEDLRGNVPCESLIHYEGVPVRFFTPGWLRYNQAITSPAMQHWLTLHASEYDLIDIHYLFTPTTNYAAHAARKAGVPYTMRAMGQLTPWSLKHHALRKSVWKQLYERGNLHCAARVHCTSEEEVQDVRRYGCTTRTAVLPLGVTPTTVEIDAREKLRAILNVSSDSKIVLFYSRLHQKKNVECAIAICAQTTGHLASAHLVIAGDGDPDYLRQLKQLCERLGVVNRVHFLGFVSGAKRNIIMQGSDLFVLPSFSENFGLAVVEAMSVGLPVIISTEVQIHHLIADSGAGVVISLHEQQSWISVVDNLLGDEKKRIQMGKYGRLLVEERFQWPAIAVQLKDIYEEILTPTMLHGTNEFT